MSGNVTSKLESNNHLPQAVVNDQSGAMCLVTNTHLDNYTDSSSSDLKYKQYFFIWTLNVARRFFLFLDVIAESEDDEGIPLLILSVTDDIVFFQILFQKMQVDNALWSRIYQ